MNPAMITGISVPIAPIPTAADGFTGVSSYIAIDGAGDVIFQRYLGNPSGSGTVEGTAFKLSGDGKLTALGSFTVDGTGAPGPIVYDPTSGLVVGVGTDLNPDGSVYSAVYTINPAGGVSVAGTFNVNSTGLNPVSLVLGASGVLYGTTTFGGPDGINPNTDLPIDGGTVFSIPASGGAPTVVAPFNAPTGGELTAGLVSYNGSVYGTATGGGPNADGMVFSTTGGTLNTVSPDFPANSNSENNGLAVANGVLFGTDNAGSGQIWHVPIGGRAVTFNNVAIPLSGPQGLVNDNGVVVGVLSGGGSVNHGSVFTIDASNPNAPVYNQILSFSGPGALQSGGTPFGPPVLDANGNVWGVSQGENATSTVFWTLSGLAVQFATQPQNVNVNQVLPPVKVTSLSGSPVTLSLAANAAANESYFETQTPVNGVATFSDLSFSKAGSYTLVATSGGASVRSNSFMVGSTVTQQTMFTWTGKGPRGNWSNGLNWAGGVAPASGKVLTLIFPSGTLNPINVDDIPGLSVGSFQIYGNYIMGANATMTLSGGLTFLGQGGGCVVGIPLTLSGNVNVTSGAGDILQLPSPIQGAGGLTLNGPGVVTMPNGNTYTGVTALQGGIVQDFNNAAFGTGVVVLAGGTLTVGGFSLELKNSISVAGNMTLSGAATGQIEMDGGITVIANSRCWTGDGRRSEIDSIARGRWGEDADVSARRDHDRGALRPGDGPRPVRRVGDRPRQFFGSCTGLGRHG